MIRKIYLDARGEEVKVQELYDHEVSPGLSDLIHGVNTESVTITYRTPMKPDNLGVDCEITHIQYEGFYVDEDEVGGEPCGDEEE